MGAGLCAMLLPPEYRAVTEQLLSFPDSDVTAQNARPLVIATLCFLPALASIIYACGGTLDRYVTRQFLGIFTICLSALCLIFLLIDASGRVGDFLSTGHFLSTFLIFYACRFPAIILVLLPYSMLLALLHSLGKLSTNREIIAMVQSGRGIVRISLPLIIAGTLCSIFNLGLNYHWAPIAEGRQDEVLAQASDKPATKATQVLYHNTENRRLWMIGAFPPNYQKDQPLRNIEITTTDANYRLSSRLFASHALWDRSSRQWTFDNPVLGNYTPGRPPIFKQLDGPLTINGWSETPWQLIKPGLSAIYLGIPDLNAWLQANSRHQPFADAAPYLTQWHYRWAFPCACLVTVLLATPLAIHFSRRGPGGGIFLAVVLSAIMLLVSNIVLAFGAAGTLHPALAAWLPNIAFTALGLYLFHRRVSGRPIYQSLRRLFSSE